MQQHSMDKDSQPTEVRAQNGRKHGTYALVAESSMKVGDTDGDMAMEGEK